MRERHEMWERTPHSLTPELPRSCSEPSASLKYNFSSLPKVKTFHSHEMTFQKYVILLHMKGTEINLSTFITTNPFLLLNYGVLTLQLLHGFKHQLRRRKHFFVHKETEESLSVNHDTSLLASKPFVICITFLFYC